VPGQADQLQRLARQAQRKTATFKRQGGQAQLDQAERGRLRPRAFERRITMRNHALPAMCVGDDLGAREKGRAIHVVGLMLRVDDVPHAVRTQAVDQLRNLDRLLRKGQGVDQDADRARYDQAGRDLVIQFAGEDVDIVRKPLCVHGRDDTAQPCRLQISLHNALRQGD